MSMTSSYPKAEILTGPQRRRRWSVSEKLEIVAETREPGVTVSLGARRRGVSPNQLFSWRRLAEQGALTATRAERLITVLQEHVATLKEDLHLARDHLAEERQAALKAIEDAAVLYSSSPSSGQLTSRRSLEILHLPRRCPGLTSFPWLHR